jgi:hypothetical protein
MTSTRPPNSGGSGRLAAALRVAATITLAVGVVLAFISIFVGVERRVVLRMPPFDAADPSIREARAWDMRAFWRDVTGRTARRIYRLAAAPVLLITLAGWITAAYGLWTGAAVVGAFAMAVFVYLIVTSGSSETASKRESATPPTRDAERVAGPSDVAAEPTTSGPGGPMRAPAREPENTVTA